MMSVTDFILRVTRRVYSGVAVVSTLLLLLLGWLSFSATEKQVDSYVTRELSSRVSAANTELGLVNLSRDISSFCESLERGFGVRMSVVIYKQDKPVAECGLSRTQFSRVGIFYVSLLDRTEVRINYSIELLNLVLSSLYPVILVLFVFLVIFFIGRIFLKRSLEKAMSSIHRLVEDLKKAASDSAHLQVSLSGSSDFEEVASIVTTMNSLLIEIDRLNKIDRERHISQETTKLALQVSHDIRSPLTALELVSHQFSGVSEETRIIARNAINRIRDIANSLLKKREDVGHLGSLSSGSNTAENKKILLSTVIESIVTEKRIQYRSRLGIDILFDQNQDSYGIFIAVDVVEFKRILSNLIDNSVEAISGSGKVTVEIAQEEANVCIKVVDTGKGMPKDIVDRLGNRGVTFGKKQGTGLGVSHAKETIEVFGGSIKIDSVIGSGTTVSLKVPSQSTPGWFVQKIVLNSASKVVVVDDDQAVHQIWKRRIVSVTSDASPIDLEHFASVSEFKNYYSKNYEELSLATFLIDYEFLGERYTGLDIVEQLAIQKQAILVTSRFEEPEIRTRCEKIGLRLIPKSLSALIPIEVC